MSSEQHDQAHGGKTAKNQQQVQVLSRDVSRELDEEVAEKVMGWRVERRKPDWYPVEVALFFKPGYLIASFSSDERSCNAMMYRNGVDASDGFIPTLPSFSEEIADAWLVVEEMVRRGWKVDVQNRYPPTWACHVHFPAPDFRKVFEHHDTAALAICLAALAAVDGSPRTAEVTQ